MEKTTKTQDELKKEKEALSAKRSAAAKKGAETKRKADAAKKEEETTKIETTKVETTKVETTNESSKKEEKKKVEEVTLMNVLGEEVPITDYFYNGSTPAGFNGTCGRPVDREDLITLFHKIFKKSDNILFYKQLDREVYIVIIPIKYSKEIGDFNDSIDGDFQKHAISFLNEGSVNLDTMRKKLEKINNFVNYSDR